MVKQWVTLVFLVVSALLMPLAHAVGLGGYDPVTYFTDNHPLRGSPGITAQVEGETYHFSSTQNRDAFAANPEKYLPQYGGYCAFAVANNKLAPGDPTVFKIVNNKLYLNVNQDVAARWERDVPGYIRAGDANWPKLKK